MIPGLERVESDLILRKPDTAEFFLRVAPLTSDDLTTVQHSRYYTVIWVRDGYGTVKHVPREVSFDAPCALFFSPHQPYSFSEDSWLSGVVVQFASDFYCIELYHHETFCSGILFNNIYDAPLVQMDRQTEAELSFIVEKMIDELATRGEAAEPVLLQAHLKIFLIQATRNKKSQSLMSDEGSSLASQQTALKLKALIESHYAELKKPSDYAELLNITVGALNKLTHRHFGRSLTAVIQERVVLEAKRRLVLTDKLVKTVAHELGYDDEYYFSRMFAKATGLSPSQYRKIYLWTD